MLDWLSERPGRLFALATVLPLAAFALMALAGLVRAAARPYRDRPAGSFVFWLLGGDTPIKLGARFAVGMMAGSAVLAVVGLVWFLGDAERHEHLPAVLESHWAERFDWVRIGGAGLLPGADARPAMALQIGYRIDHLSAVLFTMVAVVATLIFVFSTGYMADETTPTVEDHELHLARRGRYGRFFLYLSLFCFSMFNLVVADNLFQVFVSWELVGVCSYFLIGFYYERPSASGAAVKAFVMNRVGDAGFLVGMMIVWTYLGTFNFQEMFQRLRSPKSDAHGSLALADQFVRVNPQGAPTTTGVQTYALPGTGAPPGSHVALFPVQAPGHFHGLGYGRHQDREFTIPAADADDPAYGVIPYYLLVVAGFGVFLGCVGKSAQFPLHTWLPDAMEGPTPVSALIHAATMVAAGVYLVGRCYPMFTPEVLLGIAYTGAITLFFAATVAVVMTDIKRVLAYSTVSQLGFMMLALGVGGWVAGLTHLLTHAFFKALLFLAAGSVILGCHHEQDLRQMGGLRRRIPLTAYTMLIGVLAIAGTPFFSGWYSKDMILSSALGFGLAHREHLALFIVPLATAGLTAFYMFRLWFLAFTGSARSESAGHAHESPWVMTVPLVVLALFSFGVAWGWPPQDAEASQLARVHEHSRPAAVTVGFVEEHKQAEEHHTLAGLLALALAAAGAGLAVVVYGLRRIDPARWAAGFARAWRFLQRKWYFDEVYDAAFVGPTVALARATRDFDKRQGETEPDRPRVDAGTLDGLVSAPAVGVYRLGLLLRRVQTGLLRRYVLGLLLTTVALFAILSYLASG
jgi:NADH-quinone oxidoreductase subunit L